jgi:hypothetical protein
MRRRILGWTAAALCVGLIAATAAAGSAFASTDSAAGSGVGRTIAVHEPNQAAFAAAKARLNSRYGLSGHGYRAGSLQPAIDLQWDGVFDTRVSPPDPNGAIGPNNYIEIINVKYGIYDRSGGLINSGDISTLFGSGGFLSDPFILWDTVSQKFFATVVNVSNNRIEWAVSKNDNPLNASDFCHYETDFGYGTALPDYPKLGNTPTFLLIGTNDFNPGYVGSSVLWISKANIGPAPIVNCPAQGIHGRIANIKNADGSQAFTPVPGIMTDNTNFPSLQRGYVVAIPASVGNGGSANYITLYSVNDLASGAALTPAKSVPVPSYQFPPDAPQCSSPRLLSTLDGRLEHAVWGKDPLSGTLSIWTSHSVLGGAGAEQRWYEVNATTGAVVKQGVATSPTLFVFNGALSPDRRVGPDGMMAFGGDMVMGFNTSNATNCSAIQMISKVGANPQSGFVLVTQSTGPDADFTCGSGSCRWGDYSGATPDPVADVTQPVGRVWLTNMFNAPSSSTRTENWEATP